MKKILFVLITFLLQSLLTYCQTNQKELSTKKPEFKKSAQVFEENDRTREAALEDLDEDGDSDTVFSSLGSSAQVLFNDGKGFFKDSGQKFASGTHGIAIGDLDNDGDKDLYFAPLRTGPVNPVYLNDGDLDAYLLWENLLYINDGKGDFRKSSSTLPMIPSFSDMNGDGLMDIITTDRENPAQIWINDGKGKFFDSGIALHGE